MAGTDFEPRLHAATRAWVEEGLVTPEQAERIRARHPVGESEPGAVARALYAAAGVLLGAAGIALVAVGLELDRGQLPLALIALGFVALGGAVRRAFARPLLGDALLVAALPPAVASGFGDAEAFSLLGVLVPAGLLAWRRDGIVPSVAVVAFGVGAASASGQWTEAILTGDAQEDAFATAWAALQVALLAALLARDRLVERRDDGASNALAVAALAISLAVFFNRVVDALTSEGVEMAVGGAMLLVAGLGAWMRHRGVVLGAAVALAVDAIAFGFDVGGPLTGTLTLLVVAGLLIWQAEVVKRYLSPERPL